LLLVFGFAASAQTTTTTTNFTVAAMVPDASLSGLASAKTISTPVLYATDVNVTLKLSGTFNGDMYCYLTHGTNRAVLLNRAGRRASSSLGYSDDGFNVKFDDAAANGDVHKYRLTLNSSQAVPIVGALTNSWAPDARTTSPTNVLETDARSTNAMLAAFNGLNPNGEWVLFVADMEAGDIYTLDNWGLEITGYTALSITAQPVDKVAECFSGSATFAVTASGSAPLTYQWRFGGSPISDATNDSFTVSNPTFAS